MSEIVCPSCKHDIGADCHTKLDTLERKCHCTYWARDIAEKLIGDLQVENDALQAKLVTAEYIAVDYRNEWANVCEQRDALRAELDGMNKMIASSPLEDALIKERDEWKSAHDNLANQLSIANDTVEIAWEGLRELEYQGFHLYVPDVTEIAQDYLRRIEKGGLPELRKQLDIAVEALKCYVKLIDDDLNENGQPLNKEWSDAFIKGLDALAEIEKIGGVNDTQSRQ